MSSFEKIVKLACKPKAAPPKAKYIDPIIAATYAEDGAVHDVCRALSPRFREPNAIIVFKALIVLHTMIRNGATDNVLGYLSQADVLRLRNVGNGQWEGYTAPQNLQNYAHYLDFRIRAYKDLKHDPIRVQSETNRDLRVGTLGVDEDGRDRRGSLSGGSGGPANRRQTIVGRKLRIMTVEKGLLRETKIVQKMIDSLLQCKFYLDDLEDELTITALRILVKDLLVLFQACNEGVINLLESYFEMAYTDASAALTLYRHFCAQTENVVEYLTVARKLENLLNVPIPSLKHAPVSLAGSLEEYLRDPNFEQNRIEYKTNKELADKSSKQGKRSVKRTEEPIPPVPKIQASTSKEEPKPQPAPGPSSTPVPKKEVNKELADFFASIEPDEPNLFNQQTSPTTGGSPPNPFGQPQPFATAVPPNGMNPFPLAAGLQGPSPFINLQPTGPFPLAATGPTMQQQTTGFPGGMTTNPFPAGFGVATQPTGAPNNNFLNPNLAGAASPFARPASAAPNFAANGAGAAPTPGFLQPQLTGANPFRQSMLAPQGTGLPFGGLANTSPFGASGASPFGNFSGGNTAPFNAPMATGAAGNSPFSTPFGNASASNQAPGTTNSNSPFAPTPSAAAPTKVTPPFARPASTPINGSGPAAQPLTAQQTGSRNPFGRPKSPPPPPVPPVPTMGQLASSAFGASFGSMFSGTAIAPSSGPTAPFASTANTTQNGTSSGTGNAPANASSIASEFVFNKPQSDASAPTTGASLFGSSNFSSLSPQSTSTSSAAPTFSSTFSAFSATPTGSSTATSVPSISALKPQTTGFGGSSIKPFKPASSFGASLMESLPTIPQGSTLPTTTGFTQQNGTNANGAGTGFTTSTSFGSGSSGMTTQATGLGGFSNVNAGLQPQMTGGNPFRASMFPGSVPPGALSNGTTTQPAGLTANPTGFGMTSPFLSNKPGAPSFGSNLFGTAPTNPSGPGTTSLSQPPTMPGAFPSFGQLQQQQPAPSLI